MIQSIELKNFQSHKKTKIDFDPGVNIITGPSDSGKTAVLRAINLAINNRPSGNAIRSTWGGKTEVKIYTDDGAIVRSKDKAEEYVLHLDGGSIETEPIIFHAFGTNVPEEISKFLNMTDINFQSQLDAPFLLSDTPGAVATHFNKIARLDKIDTATANINKWVRELNADVTYKTKDLVKKQEELKQYEYLQKFEIDVEVLEEWENKIRSKKRNINSLQEILDIIVRVEDKIAKKEKILPMGILVDGVIALKTDRRVKDATLGILELLLKAITEVHHDIDKYQNVLAVEKPVNVLLGLFTNKTTLENQFSTLKKALLTISNTKALLKENEAKFARLFKSFEDNMGDTCLLCGQPIKTHTHK